MVFPSMMKFHLGKLVITPAVLMNVPVEEIGYAIDRHVCGQWGSVSDNVRLANNTALRTGARLLSVYHVSDETELRVLTTGDRLTTIIHLPGEFIPESE
jgi:hypothetical protein